MYSSRQLFVYFLLGGIDVYGNKEKDEQRSLIGCIWDLMENRRFMRRLFLVGFRGLDILGLCLAEWSKRELFLACMEQMERELSCGGGHFGGVRRRRLRRSSLSITPKMLKMRNSRPESRICLLYYYGCTVY